MTVLGLLTRSFARRKAGWRCGPIGMDLALEKLHMVQLACTKEGGLSLVARASVPFGQSREALLSSPHELRRLIARGLAGDKFQGKRVASAIPAGVFRTQTIEYSVHGDDSEEAAIGRHLAGQLDGTLSDFLLDFIPLRAGTAQHERQALVAISRRSVLMNYMETLRMAGLRVAAMEIGPAAIRRLVGTMPSDGESDRVLVITSGLQRTYLTLISGRRLLADEPVDVGEQDLVRSIATATEQDPQRTRAQMLRRGLHAAAAAGAKSGAAREGAAAQKAASGDLGRIGDGVRDILRRADLLHPGGNVSRIYLLGSIARWPGADLALSALTGMTITNMPNPIGLVGAGFADATADCLAPEIAVATGMALRGLSEN